jgi:CRISPR-associated protein Cas1
MPGVFLTTPGTKVALVSERLHIEIPPQEDGAQKTERDIPLMDVDQVVVTDAMAVSMPALAECMRRNIPVLITSHGERVIGICLPPAPSNVARLAQYEKSRNDAFSLALAVEFVAAKIVNSRRVLQRLAVNRPEAEVAEPLGALNDLAVRCRRAESVDTLRGYEGTAAGRYFEAYGQFFPEECPFERRSRRPPHNAVNAILSYAYTLMAAEMECQIHTVGLDPTVGFLHEPTDRRASLALDLIEPFRAPIADALALDLVSHGMLKPREHFEQREGGVYLNLDGRRRFFVAYERRMGRDFRSEQTGCRTSLRAEFHRQAVAVKQAVLNDEAFEPFLMN